jgi:hypothetical protein
VVRVPQPHHRLLFPGELVSSRCRRSIEGSGARGTLESVRETAEVERGAPAQELLLRLAGDAPVLRRDPVDEHLDVLAGGT